MAVQSPPEILYVSPTGDGIGTQAQPTNLTTALASGKDFYMTDGVYQFDDRLYLQAGVVARAVDGARPVVTRSDGETPDVYLDANAECHGVWFGGATGEAQFVDVAPGAKLYDCVFWNYYNCIVNAGDDVVIDGCKFIACGNSPLQHPVYVSRTLQQGHPGTIVQGCMMIGCAGYAITYFHDPDSGVVTGNFAGDCWSGLCFDGTNHQADKNIFWSIENTRLWLDGTATVTNNVFWGGVDNITLGDGQTITGNHYIGDDWQEADVVSNLGASSEQINAWIDAIEAAFVGTPQQVHDAEIDFSGITGMLEAWQA